VPDVPGEGFAFVGDELAIGGAVDAPGLFQVLGYTESLVLVVGLVDGAAAEPAVRVD
jgi:hypothetical protein